MSIFGKKPNETSPAEGDAHKSTFDAPNLEKYSYSPGKPIPGPVAALEPPQVHKAAPPAVNQSPGATPSPSVATGARVPAQTQTNALTPVVHKESAEGPRSTYTIDDVIRLMRELPDSKKEMVVIIVQKTLLSAKIDVGAIIDDAQRKVDRLTRVNDKNQAEIRELEEAIVAKKSEVDRVAKELEETNSVKQIFEATYGQHIKSSADPQGTADKTASANFPQIKLF